MNVLYILQQIWVCIFNLDSRKYLPSWIFGTTYSFISCDIYRKAQGLKFGGKAKDAVLQWLFY